ncbi:hypothetical protein Tco_0124424, partial [Tanacetum coccineum]
GNPEILLQDHAVVDSGCSCHMTGNKAYLLDYEYYNGGFVAFGSDPKGGRITKDDAKQTLQDELEKMITQEMVAQAVNDAARQEFEEDKRNNASSNEVVQATSTLTLSTDMLNVSTANTESTTNADSDDFSNKGIFSRAYDDDDVGAKANVNNIDNIIVVSPTPTLRIHKVHHKKQILGDPNLAVQTRGKIQKASLA